jgi:hypothetical protein
VPAPTPPENIRDTKKRLLVSEVALGAGKKA